MSALAPQYDVEGLIESMSSLPEAGSVDVGVVFLNGPPGAGKDTAGAALVRQWPTVFTSIKFAEPLKRAVYADAGLPSDLPIDFFDSVKDAPLALFGGRSFRQSCINKSEKDLKPIYGEDYFGILATRAVARAAWQGYKVVVVTDSGFASEAEPIMRAVGVRNCLLLRVHADRRGKSFAGDSRSYIRLPVESRDVYNDADGNSYDFVHDVLLAVDAWRFGA